MEAASPPLEKTELERLANAMPVGLLVEDGEGRILWVNTTFIEFIGRTFEQLRGSKVSDLPLTRVPGGGSHPDFCHVESSRKGGTEWLLCSWQRLSPGNGRGLIARFYLDATDHRRVQRFRGLHLPSQDHGNGATDQVTGALDRGGIMQVLEAEISRSRRYHNPLAVIRLHLDPSTLDLQQDESDRFMSAMARVLREQTRWVDRLGRWSEREFLLVLPESNAAAAGSLADKIQRHVVADRQPSASAADLSSLMMRFGIAEWQRGDDASTLLERVQSGLEIAGDAKVSNG